MRKKIKSAIYDRIESLAEQYGGLPETIRLSIYEDDESLSYFRPSEYWAGGNAEHTALMKWLSAEIERDFKTKVELKLISTSDYWRWLGKTGKKDNAGSRAEFISM